MTNYTGKVGCAMTNVDRLEIVSDERGFELHLWPSEALEELPDGGYILNIHAVAVDLLAAVEREIAPWHREGMSVLAEMKAAGAFSCNPDESAGMDEGVVVAIREDGSYRVEPDEDAYDPTDPKHPRYHSTHADIWDAREGK